MQKALDQVNLLNDISGMSGLRILDAILPRERDPYQLFLAYCELVSAERSPELVPRMCRAALMINQNHNVQTRSRTQFKQCLLFNPPFAKALLVDYDALEKSRAESDIR